MQIRDLGETLGELGPGLDAARAAEEASATALRSAEVDMDNWQSRWDQFKEEAGEASRTSDVEKARIEQIESQMRRLVERRERCSAEIARLAGLHEGRTTGAPLALRIPNHGRKGGGGLSTVPRPGHADLAGMQKYGFR